MILKILLLSSAVLLSACALFSTPVKQIETVKVEVSKPALNLPNPEPLKLREQSLLLSHKKMLIRFSKNLKQKDNQSHCSH